jgi:hypothetical protein
MSIRPGDKVRPLGNDEVYEVSKTMRSAWGQVFLSAYRQTPTGTDGLFINSRQVELVERARSEQ